jgi:hypothetical protein
LRHNTAALEHVGPIGQHRHQVEIVFDNHHREFGAQSMREASS